MSTSDKTYTWDEIMKHNNEKDCWIVLQGNVVDITDWLPLHPGGSDTISQMATRDVTNMYQAVQAHTKAGGRADNEWKKRIIGKVDPNSVRPQPQGTSSRRKFDQKPIKYGWNINPMYFWLAILVAFVGLIWLATQ